MPKTCDFSDDPLQRVVRISNNGKLMATGGIDGKVRVWSFPKMQLLFELEGHTKEVLNAIYPNSNFTIVNQENEPTSDRRRTYQFISG